jgi:hypothetical protein
MCNVATVDQVEAWPPASNYIQGLNSIGFARD